VPVAVVIPIAFAFAKIAVAVAVPAMVVFEAASVALPVALKEPLSIMAWRYPACTAIRRTSPISGMPSVAISHWVPVPFHPSESRTWSRGWGYINPRRRRRADPNSDGDLAEQASSGEEHQSEQVSFHWGTLLL
jgi:hypothetical protein